MPDNSAIADRMKFYEKGNFGDAIVLPQLPIIARLDGRAFHTFTKGMERPYDIRLHDLMRNVATWLLEETSAHVAYTQSDEISLIWWIRNFRTQMVFGGRVQKLTSLLASMCSVYFNRKATCYFDVNTLRQMPVFDCRVWNVPNAEEAVNYLVWRQMDATRNSISMAAQSIFSHKELMGKSCNQMQEMLFQKDINWSKYPDFFKNGTLILRHKVQRPFTPEEIESLPPLHNARQNPNLVIERSEIETSHPVFTKLENRLEYIFTTDEG